MSATPSHDPAQFERLGNTLAAALPTLRQAWVFGSVARNRATPASDIDIAIEADCPLTPAQTIQLIEAVAALTARAVDLIDLKTAGGLILGQILKHGIQLHGTSTDRAELGMRHLDYMDTMQPLVERILRERRQAWIG